MLRRRFASPEMRARAAARAAEAEAERQRLEADDSKQRALKDMMNATLEFRKKQNSAEEMLVRGAQGGTGREGDCGEPHSRCRSCIQVMLVRVREGGSRGKDMRTHTEK